MRYPLALLVMIVAACGPPASGLAPDDAVAAADTALTARDADRAITLLSEAADAGHLGAMGRLAQAYERGYLQAPFGRDRSTTYLAVQTWPGQGALARSRYERALAAGAEAGDPAALLAVALDLVGPLAQEGDTWRSTTAPAVRDSVASLYARLDTLRGRRLPLAYVARVLGDTASVRRHFDEAVANAEPGACWQRIWVGGNPPDLATAAGIAAHYDTLAACPEAGLVEDFAAPLLQGVRTDFPGSRAFADSLRHLGVFDRHPHLGALFAEAAGSGVD